MILYCNSTLYPTPPGPMIRTRFLPQALLLALSIGLLSLSPVQAQQGSDVSGALPQSDVSGVLMQSDQVLLQSENDRNQMSEVASVLAQALQEGTLRFGVDGGEISVPPAVATVIKGDNTQDAKQARQRLVRVLSGRGVPGSQAETLVQAASGLLSQREVDPDQFLESIRAFNATIDSASDAFLTQPPKEFLAIHAVLLTLYQATSI